MDRTNSPENFAKQLRAVVVAPAGCGKTELIVQSVGCCTGKQLILTHTHAGVDSLKARFRKYNISTSMFHVETIHSFALRYASSYPKICGLQTNTPKTSEDYDNVIESAKRFFELPLAKQIFRNTYAGVYVDEYQDCTVGQHQLIMELANLLPCRIVGDPLQDIFRFGTNQIVEWNRDVFPNFNRLDDLTEPWRWKNTNLKLGEWLLQEVRHKLLQNSSIDISRDLEDLGCFCEEFSDIKTKNVLLAALDEDFQTYVITAANIPGKSHHLASQMQNRYKSIEPITSEEICKYAASIDATVGIARLINVLKFAETCLTGIKQDCNDIVRAIQSGKHRFQIKRKIEFVEYSTKVIEDASYVSIHDLYQYILSSYQPTLSRYQLWTEMNNALREIIAGNYKNLESAVWEIRSRYKYLGRRIPKRCISRTLLLKGLECEYAIIVDAGSFNDKNLYVAMTRPSKKLHLLFNESTQHLNDLRPRCPKCNIVLVQRNGTRGLFLGCPNYPQCKHTQKI